MLEQKVSRLVNVATFKVDKSSYNNVKKSMDHLAKYSEGKLSNVKAFKDLANAAAKAEAKVREQNARSTDQRVRNSNRAGAAEAKARREAADAARRTERADLKRRQVALQMGGILGATAEQQNHIRRVAEHLTQEYQRGDRSIESMNHHLREQITLVQRAARTKRRDELRNQRGGAGGGAGGMPNFAAMGASLLAALGPVGIAIAAAGAAAAAVVGLAKKSISIVSDTTERTNNVVRGAEAVHTNANALLALAAYQRQHGVSDATPEKIQDNLNSRVA